MLGIDYDAHKIAAQSLPKSRLIIGGEDRTSGSGGVFEHINPSTGLVQGQIPLAGPDEIDEAVAAAQSAFEVWNKMRAGQRRALLFRFADLIRDHLDDMARIAPLETGMPYLNFRKFGRVIEEWTSYYAGWADKISGGVDAFGLGEHFEYSVPEPYGVVGHVITWNAPAGSLAMKIPACLAAGNAVVIKPSELSPWSAVLWAELGREAGLPNGLINVVTGPVEAGQALVKHPGIGKVSFTGGPSTAQSIMRDAAENLTPLVFELGGKGPNLFFADADMETAVRHSAWTPMGNSGQGCAHPTRLLIEARVYDTVVEKISQSLQAMKVGDPLDPFTTHGPVITGQARDRILATIDEARTRGWGQLVTGGRRIGEVGNFIEPTLFADVDNKSPLGQQEVFGPVLVAMPFSSEDEAVELANDSQFGLTAWLQSRDIDRIHRLIPRLRAGTVMVNAGVNTVACCNSPFGGLGLSGFGREGGRAGLYEFLRLKGVSIGRDPNNFMGAPALRPPRSADDLRG